MIQNAIAKLKTEIEQSKNNQFVQVVGEFLLDHLNKFPQDAEKIMVIDKTVAKSIDELWRVARGRKVGNSAGMYGEEVMAIVFKYFGIESAVTIPVSAAAPVMKAERPDVTTKKNNG